MEHFYLEKDKNQPVFILLHGTGGDEHSLVQLDEFLNPAASLLGFRGRVSENGANRFFRRFAEGAFDLVDLANQTVFLHEEIKRLAEVYQLDFNQMILLGYSNGANIGSHLLLTEETDISQGIFFHPMLLEERAFTEAAVRKNVWLSYGEYDPLVETENFIDLTQAFASRGAEVATFVAGMSHGIVQEELASAKAWLDGGEA